MSTHRLLASSDSAAQQGPLTVSRETGTQAMQETPHLRHQVFAKALRNNLRRCKHKIEDDDSDKYCRHLVVRNHATVEIVGSTHLLRQDDVDLADMPCVETGFELKQILKLHALLHN